MMSEALGIPHLTVGGAGGWGALHSGKGWRGVRGSLQCRVGIPSVS